MDEKSLKSQVKNHWESETCGTRYATTTKPKEYFEQISNARYDLEPYIPEFANFPGAQNKKILEIGVGAGSDFVNWMPHVKHATGVDLTEAAIELTKKRLDLAGIPVEKYFLTIADAEHLQFPNNSFDIVYSWGVLHHTPETLKAYAEVYRVLAPGGTAKIMVYNLYSWVTLMLYLIHGPLKGNFGRTPREIVFEQLESPGTKVYTRHEATEMFRKIGFKKIKVSTKLSPADSLTNKASSKYSSWKYRLTWNLFPSKLIKLLGHRFGLYLLIEGEK